MEIRVIQGSITDISSDVLVVNLFEGVTVPGGATGAVDSALGGTISEMIASKELTGKLMETALIHTCGKIAPKRVLVVGLGKSGKFDIEAVHKVSAAAMRSLRQKGVRTVTSIIHGAGIGGLNTADAARAVVEGAITGLYEGDLYKTTGNEDGMIERFTVVEHDEAKIPAIQSGAREGEILGKAVNEARTLGNEPGNRMTPTILAERARDAAQLNGLEYEVLDKAQMEEMGMNGILCVASGSVQPPKLIILRYKAGADRPTLALVGKGLTFDSGGISIKPSEGMQKMKFDMCGGAAVIQALAVIAQLKPDINVTGIIPATENLSGGAAFKPGDVIKCMSGKTVEIISTDAEGRMILSDAITYAAKQGANYIVDIATLTGACVVALGNDITGLMTNNRELLNSLTSAASVAGERVWELPLTSEYLDMLKSTVADIKNCGSRWGGAIQAGLFLQEFVEGTPWVHMDIAGPAYTEDDCGNSYRAAGATGVGVGTMAQLAVKLAEQA